MDVDAGMTGFSVKCCRERVDLYVSVDVDVNICVRCVGVLCVGVAVMLACVCVFVRECRCVCVCVLGVGGIAAGVDGGVYGCGAICVWGVVLDVFVCCVCVDVPLYFCMNTYVFALTCVLV